MAYKFSESQIILKKKKVKSWSRRVVTNLMTSACSSTAIDVRRRPIDDDEYVDGDDCDAYFDHDSSIRTATWTATALLIRGR